MATEVLRPHDVLMAQHMRPVPAFLSRRKPKPNPHPKPPKKTPSPRPEARKRREGSPKPAKAGATATAARSSLVAGHVTILKKGDSLVAFEKLEAAAVGTGRLGPNPEMVPKHMGTGYLKIGAVAAEMYAGSAFSVSPSPSSLPLPSFPLKKDGSAIVDCATKDLRRLLRLG